MLVWDQLNAVGCRVNGYKVQLLYKDTCNVNYLKHFYLWTNLKNARFVVDLYSTVSIQNYATWYVGIYIRREDVVSCNDKFA